jgi:hypothetical protein
LGDKLLGCYPFRKDKCGKANVGHALETAVALGAPETRERETRALLAASNERPDASLHIVTRSTDTASTLAESVTVHSAANWLLNSGEPASAADKKYETGRTFRSS